MQTGKEHWEILLRARAIENEIYIVAPNQFGFHGGKRQSYGNSMIIDPWGKVMARASDKECFIVADIDLNYQKQVRQGLPCLSHKRL
jgi:predicted amidohydrolase